MVATSGPGSESRWNSAQAPLAFVGRAAELAELVGGLPNTNLHGRRLWLVSGEAGIGKTRLVRELTAVANASGSEVAWGQCWDGSGTPPFWPWTQIIRRLRGLDSNADLRQLVLGDDVSDADAFTLYDAVASQLRASARERPTLVVLDDIHRADVGTLQLTRFVAEHLVDAPIQVVVTLRPPASLDRCVNTRYLDHLAEVGHTVDLGGLDLEAIAQMTGDDDDVPGIRAVTGGNPLHIEHLVRSRMPPAPSATATSDGVGGGLRARAALGAVLAARITGMDEEALDLLAALEVLGHAATADAAAQITGIRADRVRVLAAALREAGLARWRRRLSRDGLPNGIDDWMFINTSGRHVNPESLSQLFDRLQATLPDLIRLRFHDLRRIHASLLIASGEDVKVVSERPGHANVAFTMHTYQHLLPGMSASAATRFAELIANASR